MLVANLQKFAVLCSPDLPFLFGGLEEGRGLGSRLDQTLMVNVYTNYIASLMTLFNFTSRLEASTRE